MNKELRELFENSKLTRKEFAEKIGIGKQRLNDVFKENAFELKPSTFKKYKERYALKNNEKRNK